MQQAKREKLKNEMDAMSVTATLLSNECVVLVAHANSIRDFGRRGASAMAEVRAKLAAGRGGTMEFKKTVNEAKALREGVRDGM